MKPPLAALKMEWHDVGDGHDELTLSMSVIDEVVSNPDAFPHVGPEQLADAAQFGAGILGRIATEAHREIALEAREHGCHGRGAIFRSESGRVMVDGCNVSGPASLLAPRAEYANEAPALWIVVPDGRVTAWRERLNDWLEQITNDRPLAAPAAPTRRRSTA